MDLGLDDAIAHVHAVAACRDDVTAPESGQMLRDDGLGQAQGLADLGHRGFPALEHLDDLQALGVPQQLDDLGRPGQHRRVDASQQCARSHQGNIIIAI